MLMYIFCFFYSLTSVLASKISVISRALVVITSCLPLSINFKHNLDPPLIENYNNCLKHHSCVLKLETTVVSAPMHRYIWLISEVQERNKSY